MKELSIEMQGYREFVDKFMACFSPGRILWIVNKMNNWVEAVAKREKEQEARNIQRAIDRYNRACARKEERERKRAEREQKKRELKEERERKRQLRNAK